VPFTLVHTENTGQKTN